MNKPPQLYHGGRRLQQVLEPRQAVGFGGEGDCQRAVYAVAHRDWAIPFALTLVPASQQAVFSVDIDVSPPRIRLKETAVRWKEAGYLYTLPSETFQRIDDHQWVSYEPVRPLRVDIITPEDYRHWIEFIE